MTTALTTKLTALLTRWDALAAESAHKIEATAHPVQGGFYAGVMFGIEMARDELAAALARAVAKATRQSV
jgi:hypothetical protein